MSTPTYFGGQPSNMGRVTALPATTFAELVEQFIAAPIALGITQAEMQALPEAEQNEKKKTAYLVPAVFKTSPSPRQTGSATHCNLLFIDVDDPKEASRIINAGVNILLGDMSAVVWHTARSVPDRPRLRIMVPANGVPVAQYAMAVTGLAGLLGMNDLTHESKVAVQPMYLPVEYTDMVEGPIVYSKTDGTVFDHSQLVELEGLKRTTDEVVDVDIGDIEYLRAPLEDVTVEEVADALSKVDPACSHQEWVEVGMGLKHQFGAAGFDLWDQWSAQSKDKYPQQSEMKKKWESFRANPKDRVPTTIRSVIKVAVEAGWNNRPIAGRMFESAREWIRDSARTPEDLLVHGAKRIAKLGAVVGPLEQKVLVADLFGATKARGLRGPTVVDLAKEIRRLSSAATRANSSQPPWATGIVFLTAPNLFFRYLDNRKMRGEVVDLIYKSPNPEISARDYLIHDIGIPVVENLRYNPAETKRVFTHEGVPYINTYRPTYARPDKSMAIEAGELYLRHAQNLLGDPYWITFTDWDAYQVQHSGKKIRWAPAIQSGVGGGKGFLAYILTLILGQSNVQRLAAEHILEGNHNGWAAGSQLTVVDEVRIIGPNRHRIMDKLKPVISDDMVSVRQIYEPVMTCPNVTNYLFFTNYHDALAVHSDDRRYFYVESPLQTKKQILNLGPTYFDDLYRDATRLAGGLRAFFEAWPISKNFEPEGRAPMTPFLRTLAMQTATPLARAVLDTIHDQPHPLVRKDLVSLTALRAMMPTNNLPPFTDQGLSSILREEGFVSVGRHQIDGATHALWTMDPDLDTAARAQQRMDLL